MKKKNLYFIIGCIIILSVGFSMGLLSPTEKVTASIPEGEISGGEQPASVYYDEHWKATEAYVATATGYKAMDPSTGSETQVSGQITNFAVTTSYGQANVPQTTLEPDMVITKWKVHGHIHFE